VVTSSDEDGVVVDVDGVSLSLEPSVAGEVYVSL
jgi:hypothetical protein